MEDSGGMAKDGESLKVFVVVEVLEEIVHFLQDSPVMLG